MHSARLPLLPLVGGLGWLAVVGALAACGGSTSTAGTSSTSSESTSSSTGSSSSSSAPATFTEVYQQVLGPQCGVGCHRPNENGVTLGMLDMSSQATAYSNLFEVAAAGSACAGKGTRVIAGNADQSVLAEKIDPKLFPSLDCGSPMPLDANPLPQSQIDEVESWIAAGAMNN